jgi:hypothetical protein
VFADELALSYTKFYSWFGPLMKRNVYLKRWLSKVTLPDPELFMPYKNKIAYGMGYAYLIGSVAVLCGVQ